MSTITKEWLQQKIADMEATRDDIPFGLGEDGTNTLAALRIALASLEAEPVAEVCEGFTLRYIGHGPAPKSGVHIGDRLYTAPPAPIVPGEWKQWIADAVEYLEGGLEVDGELEAEGSIEAKRLLSRRAAMLQGAEPVSPLYTLPTQGSEVVNEAAWKLFNMLTEHVSLNGRQFNNLKGCFYEALKVAMGNTAAPHQEVK